MRIHLRKLLIAAVSLGAVVSVVSVAASGRSDPGGQALAKFKHFHPGRYKRTGTPHAAILRRASASATGAITDDFPAMSGAKLAQTLPDASEVVVRSSDAGEASFTAGEVCVAAYITKTEPHSAPEGCTAPGAFNREGIVITSGRPPAELLIGAVPDGVPSVVVTFGDGSTTTLKVVNNTFALRSTAPTASVSFSGPSGAVTQDAPPAPE